MKLRDHMPPKRMMMRLLLMVQDTIQVQMDHPNNDGEGMDDGEAEVKMSTMNCHLETQWVDQMDPEYLGVVMDLRDPKDPWDQWPLPS